MSFAGLFRAKPTVGIIGAGVIGLGIGWRLACAGCKVDIYDRGVAGKGASWAAAGMLAAHVEAEPTEEWTLPLTLSSQRAWPRFAAELEAASGVSVNHRVDGTMLVAHHRDDALHLRSRYEFFRDLAFDIEWLSSEHARGLEPRLGSQLSAACFSRDDGQVDNRLVVTALIAAFLKAGGHLHEHKAVDSIETRSGAVAGVVVEGVLHHVDYVVVAAGAWSGLVPGVPAVDGLPVRPIKGQMLSLTFDPDTPPIRHVVWAPKCYMVPRTDGRLLIGATTEEKDFDVSVTAGGLLALLEAAWRTVPSIDELAVSESWAGIRPGSRDDAPILGPSSLDRLVYATGHHRNGILLTPLTADAISSYILTGHLADPIRPFLPSRPRPATLVASASRKGPVS